MVLITFFIKAAQAKQNETAKTEQSKKTVQMTLAGVNNQFLTEIHSYMLPLKAYTSRFRTELELNVAKYKNMSPQIRSTSHLLTTLSLST